MDDSSKDGFQATPASTLEQQIMDACVPKNEREHWAAREITRLRAEVEDLLSVCRGVVEWDKAEENHEGTTFYQRIEMWVAVKIGAYEASDRHDAARAAQGDKT